MYLKLHLEQASSQLLFGERSVLEAPKITVPRFPVSFDIVLNRFVDQLMNLIPN